MKRNTLIITLSIGLIAALLVIFGILLSRSGGDGGVIMEETAVSPTTAPSIPTPNPEFSNVAGTYRFHAARDAITADYIFTLNPDGSAELIEQPIGEETAVSTATGYWTVEDDNVVLTFSQIDGQPIEPAAIVRVTFIDGFPVMESIEVGGEFVHLENNSFTLGVGDSGGLVDELNRRLSTIPYLNFTPPNSDIYGETTRQAVVTFQEVNGLVPTGVVDTET